MRYTIFSVDADGGSDQPVRVNRKTDRQALNAATAMTAINQMADVWQRERLVGRVFGMAQADAGLSRKLGRVRSLATGAMRPT